MFFRNLNLCQYFFDHVGKWLDRKANVNFKIYDVTDGQQIITAYVLPNISRIEGNQTMKFGQLIAYKIRKNFFLEIIYIK